VLFWGFVSTFGEMLDHWHVLYQSFELCFLTSCWEGKG
jgi:hypothetical protein